MGDINNRIKEVRLSLDKSQAQFAKIISMNQSTYAYIETGKTTVRERHISLVCSNCNVNEEWLRTGEGEMFLVQENKDINKKFGTELTKIILSSSDVTKKLILSLTELEQEELDVVNDLVDILIKKKQ